MVFYMIGNSKVTLQVHLEVKIKNILFFKMWNLVIDGEILMLQLLEAPATSRATIALNSWCSFSFLYL